MRTIVAVAVLTLCTAPTRGQCSSNGACAVAPGYAPVVRYQPVPKYRLRRYPAPAYRAPYHAPMPAPAPRVYGAPQSPRIELYPDRPTTVVVPWPEGLRSVPVFARRSGPSIVRPEPTPRMAGDWYKTGQGNQQVGIVAEFGVGGYIAAFGERGGPPLIAIGEQGIQVNASGEPDAGLTMSLAEFAEMINWYRKQVKARPD